MVSFIQNMFQTVDIPAREENLSSSSKGKYTTVYIPRPLFQLIYMLPILPKWLYLNKISLKITNLSFPEFLTWRIPQTGFQYPGKNLQENIS